MRKVYLVGIIISIIGIIVTEFFIDRTFAQLDLIGAIGSLFIFKKDLRPILDWFLERGE